MHQQGTLTSEAASPRSPLLATPGRPERAAGAPRLAAAWPPAEQASAASTAWKWDTGRPATVSRKSPSWSTLLACDPARQLRTRSTCACRVNASFALQRHGITRAQLTLHAILTVSAQCWILVHSGSVATAGWYTAWVQCADLSALVVKAGQSGDPLGRQAQLGSLAEQHGLQLSIQQAHAGRLPAGLPRGRRSGRL